MRLGAALLRRPLAPAAPAFMNDAATHALLSIMHNARMPECIILLEFALQEATRSHVHVIDPWQASTSASSISQLGHVAALQATTRQRRRIYGAAQLALTAAAPHPLLVPVTASRQEP